MNSWNLTNLWLKTSRISF